MRSFELILLQLYVTICFPYLESTFPDVMITLLIAIYSLVLPVHILLKMSSCDNRAWLSPCNLCYCILDRQCHTTDGFSCSTTSKRKMRIIIIYNLHMSFITQMSECNYVHLLCCVILVPITLRITRLREYFLDMYICNSSLPITKSNYISKVSMYRKI